MTMTLIRICFAVTLSFLFAGCAVTGVVRVGVPSDYKGDTAVIRASGGANFVQFLTGGEAHTTLKSIDGSAQAAEYIVALGIHSFEMHMTHMGVAFSGIANIDVPASERYILRGRRRGDIFEVALVREDGQRMVGTTVTANRDERLHYIPLVMRR